MGLVSCVQGFPRDARGVFAVLSGGEFLAEPLIGDVSGIGWRDRVGELGHGHRASGIPIALKPSSVGTLDPLLWFCPDRAGGHGNGRRKRRRRGGRRVCKRAARRETTFRTNDDAQAASPRGRLSLEVEHAAAEQDGIAQPGARVIDFSISRACRRAEQQSRVGAIKSASRCLPGAASATCTLGKAVSNG